MTSQRPFEGRRITSATPRFATAAQCSWTHGLPSAASIAFALLLAALGGCATFIPGADYPRVISTALADPDATRLGKVFATGTREHPGTSAFRLLPAGPDGFATRMQMANVAERTLDVQYYIIQMDDSGRQLGDALAEAASRGVRVRVLIDDSNGAGREAEIYALAASPNIEIRLFNPFWFRGTLPFLRHLEFMTRASRLDYRMHNKLFVVDNQIALVGGRNIGDEYFQGGAEFEFGDYDVFAAGPVVRTLSGTFDNYWNSAIAIPVQALNAGTPTRGTLDAFRDEARRRRAQAAGEDYIRRTTSGEPLAGMLSGKLPLVWASATVVADSPDKAKVEKGEIVGHLMHRAVANAAMAARSELLMVSPYLVPGTEGMQMLRALREKNVRVRVLTNSLGSNDVLLAHAVYTNYRPALVKAGVELFEVRPVLGQPAGSGGSGGKSSAAGRFALHAKAFVFDRRRLFIGSMNFDQRSLHLNTELGLIIDSPELARQVAARFEAIVRPANSYQILLRQEAANAPGHLVWRTEEGKATFEYAEEPADTLWRRVNMGMLTLLPLDGEL